MLESQAAIKLTMNRAIFLDGARPHIVFAKSLLLRTIYEIAPRFVHHELLVRRCWKLPISCRKTAALPACEPARTSIETESIALADYAHPVLEPTLAEAGFGDFEIVSTETTETGTVYEIETA